MLRESSKVLVTLSLFVLTPSFVGCGEETPNGVEKSISAYEGIYRVDRLTENPVSCEIEGSSTVAADRNHMVVFSGKDFFGAWIRAEGCADPAGCRQLLADYRAGGGSTVTFSYSVREDKVDHLEGVFITTGFSGGSSAKCTAAEHTNILMTRPSHDIVRIEARSIVVDHERDSDGFCTTDATEVATAGKPCNRLQVVEGTRIEAL